MHVLIVGAGIGGLTAALCCVARGIDVTVLEQADALNEIGAGIQLPPNAMKVFKSLGLDTSLEAVAVKPDAIETRLGRSGRTIFRIELADYSERKWGAPYLHIHRADYIRALTEALDVRAPDSLQLAQRMVDYSQTKDNVRVKFEDGTYLNGDVLIGADGLRSNVRRTMFGQQSPVFTGNVAWRATVPMDQLGDLAPSRTACAWMGPGRHAVTYQLRQGILANFVGVVERQDWREEGWSLRGSKAELEKDFADFHPVIRNLVQHVNEDSLYKWALFDRLPLAAWTDGRVALLGDAAHPMLPFVAQGGAMAVEDGWMVAQLLSQTDDVAGALTLYANRRFARTAKAQKLSRRNMTTFHKRTRLSQLATYGPMWAAGKVMPGFVRDHMGWLYRYDVTQAL